MAAKLYCSGIYIVRVPLPQPVEQFRRRHGAAGNGLAVRVCCDDDLRRRRFAGAGGHGHHQVAAAVAAGFGHAEAFRRGGAEIGEETLEAPVVVVVAAQAPGRIVGVGQDHDVGGLGEPEPGQCFDRVRSVDNDLLPGLGVTVRVDDDAAVHENAEPVVAELEYVRLLDREPERHQPRRLVVVEAAGDKAEAAPLGRAALGPGDEVPEHLGAGVIVFPIASPVEGRIEFAPVEAELAECDFGHG